MVAELKYRPCECKVKQKRPLDADLLQHAAVNNIWKHEGRCWLLRSLPGCLIDRSTQANSFVTAALWHAFNQQQWNGRSERILSVIRQFCLWSIATVNWPPFLATVTYCIKPSRPPPLLGLIVIMCLSWHQIWSNGSPMCNLDYFAFITSFKSWCFTEHNLHNLVLRFLVFFFYSIPFFLITPWIKIKCSNNNNLSWMEAKAGVTLTTLSTCKGVAF